jgi:hypothetical protein
VYYFMYEAEPEPGTSAAEEHGGGFVNCWIDRPTMGEAEAVAIAMIGEYGWRVVACEEVEEVDREYYADNPEGLRYFEQAVIDSEVLVFHVYPIDAPEE